MYPAEKLLLQNVFLVTDKEIIFNYDFVRKFNYVMVTENRF